MNENWATLQHVETKAALKQLAEKSRAELKPFLDARLPKTPLPKVTQAASPGSGQTVTPQRTEPQTLNMVQQMRKNKAPRLGAK